MQISRGSRSAQTQQLLQITFQTIEFDAADNMNVQLSVATLCTDGCSVHNNTSALISWLNFPNNLHLQKTNSK